VPADVPTGTVTFLFSDIEDSARLWAEGSTEIAAAVETHDGIVRGTIDRHGGYLFADDDDGFAAAFSTAVVAADAGRVAFKNSEPSLVSSGSKCD